MVGEGAAADADGVDLLDVFRDGQKTGNRTERLAEIIGVEPGADDADAAVGQCLGYLDQALIKELGLIDAYDLDIVVNLEHPGRRLDGRAGNAVRIVGDDIEVRVTFVNGRLEGGDFLLGELGAFKPADQFLGLPREHRAADYLDTARFFCIF